MAFKLAANLSFMFTESPNLMTRYRLAKESGFLAVESGFPFGYTVQQVQKAKNDANIDQVLINVFTGDVTKGELGFAAIPGDEDKFKNSITLTIDYAKALNCKKIHVMAGIVENPTAANDTVYESNLRYAVDQFQKEGIIGIIEPINPYSVPNYYLNCFDKGHIQIAQVPHRNEPNTEGELNYKYIFSVIKDIGYSGYIGLEYKPKTTTIEGLKWIENFGYKQ
ncbi:hypothetical protein G9C98_000944 [Cotesia typhae]|uniref:Putative hydroxypyruvate isomerase n=1 Tax=Cotesia typhae TaxID=2053667 RepID=A0A8J5R776_9HYME|nr:hypothetical protein G9C98_000944 [Cotesia typhae]